MLADQLREIRRHNSCQTKNNALAAEAECIHIIREAVRRVRAIPVMLFSIGNDNA
jgi:hypothetical protein